jgi:hypothetical protein
MGASTKAETATESVVVTNKTGRGQVVYADVFLAAKVVQASYTLAVARA